MRPPPGEVLTAAEEIRHHMPPRPQPAPDLCDPPCSSCHWQPSADLEANIVMVLILLLCALICVLALNGAIRCFLRSDRHTPGLGNDISESSGTRPCQHKQATEVDLDPPVAYSAGLKLSGAEDECTICLAEFVEGEELRILGSCRHGFHSQCIKRWLLARSSCPNCRRSCSLASSS